MNVKTILRDLQALSPEDQREVAEFIAFLQQRRAQSTPASRTQGSLRDEPFFGQWKDRTDIADSVEYVRELRQRQWRGQDGQRGPGGHERAD